MPALHGEGNFLDLFFHIRSLSDAETLKDAICDILADRPPRDLAEGGHGLLHVREHGVRCDAEAEAGFRPFDGAGVLIKNKGAVIFTAANASLPIP